MKHKTLRTLIPVLLAAAVSLAAGLGMLAYAGLFKFAWEMTLVGSFL